MSEIEPEYTFEAWKRRAARSLRNKTIAISKMGRLTLSDDLFEQHFSLEFSSIEVFIDQKIKAVGLKPSNNHQDGFLAKKTGNTGKARTYDLRELCVKNNIAPQHYPASWSEKYRMVIFSYRTLDCEE